MSFRAEVAAMRSSVQQWRGERARYVRAGGASLDCTAIIRTMDYTTLLDGFPVRQTGRFAILLVSEIGACPSKGDSVEMLDDAGVVTETYNIVESGVSEDSDRLEWRARVGEPA